MIGMTLEISFNMSHTGPGSMLLAGGLLLVPRASGAGARGGNAYYNVLLHIAIHEIELASASPSLSDDLMLTS